MDPSQVRRTSLDKLVLCWKKHSETLAEELGSLKLTLCVWDSLGSKVPSNFDPENHQLVLRDFHGAVG